MYIHVYVHVIAVLVASITVLSPPVARQMMWFHKNCHTILQKYIGT